MLRIAALNESDDSGEESSGQQDEPVATKEAQEAEAFAKYKEALGLQQSEDIRAAENLFASLLDHPFLVTAQVVAERDEEDHHHPGVPLLYLIHKNMAALAISRGDLVGGMKSYLEAVKIDSSEVTVWYKMGVVAKQLNNYPLARLAFEQGLQCNVHHWPCLDAVISILYVLNDYWMCLDYCSRALEQDPYYVKGLVFMRQVLKEQPSLLQDTKEMFALCDSVIYTITVDSAEATSLVQECVAIRDKRRELARVPDPPPLTLPKPLTQLSWKCVGECLLALYDSFTTSDPPKSLALELDLSEYQSIIEEKTTDSSKPATQEESTALPVSSTSTFTTTHESITTFTLVTSLAAAVSPSLHASSTGAPSVSPKKDALSVSEADGSASTAASKIDQQGPTPEDSRRLEAAPGMEGGGDCIKKEEPMDVDVNVPKHYEDVGSAMVRDKLVADLAVNSKQNFDQPQTLGDGVPMEIDSMVRDTTVVDLEDRSTIVADALVMDKTELDSKFKEARVNNLLKMDTTVGDLVTRDTTALDMAVKDSSESELVEVKVEVLCLREAGLTDLGGALVVSAVEGNKSENKQVRLDGAVTSVQVLGTMQAFGESAGVKENEVNLMTGAEKKEVSEISSAVELFNASHVGSIGEKISEREADGMLVAQPLSSSHLSPVKPQSLLSLLVAVSPTLSQPSAAATSPLPAEAPRVLEVSDRQQSMLDTKAEIVTGGKSLPSTSAIFASVQSSSAHAAEEQGGSSGDRQAGDAVVSALMQLYVDVESPAGLAPAVTASVGPVHVSSPNKAGGEATQPCSASSPPATPSPSSSSPLQLTAAMRTEALRQMMMMPSPIVLISPLSTASFRLKSLARMATTSATTVGGSSGGGIVDSAGLLSIMSIGEGNGVTVVQVSPTILSQLSPSVATDAGPVEKAHPKRAGSFRGKNKRVSHGTKHKRGSTIHKRVGIIGPEDFSVKRRSSRVRKTKKEDEVVDFQKLLKNFLPSTLMQSASEEDESQLEEASLSVLQTAADAPFTELSGSPMLEDTEKEDVRSYLSECLKRQGVIGVMYKYLVHLAKRDHCIWPAGIADLFMNVYQRLRPHLTFPSLYFMDFPEICYIELSKIALVFSELILDKFLVKKADTVVSPVVGQSALPVSGLFLDSYSEEDMMFLMGMVQTGQSELLGDEEKKFIVRVYWLRGRLSLADSKMDDAVETLDTVSSLLREEDTPSRVCIPNCCLDKIISLDEVKRQQESLKRCQSLEETQHLFDAGEYQMVVDILSATFTQGASHSRDKKLALPERHAQLELLKDSLLHLRDWPKALLWSEMALDEALHHYRRAPTICVRDSWALTLVRLFEGFHTILNEDILSLRSLPLRNLIRLTNNIIRVIEINHDVSETVTEMPIGTVLPWIQLFQIIRHEEERLVRLKVQAPSDVNVEGDVDESSNEDSSGPSPAGGTISSSLMLLNIAHEYMGRNGWCTMENGVFLHLHMEMLAKEMSAAHSTVLDDLQAAFEQCVFCLYGHPSKKGKVKHLFDHNAPCVDLTWDKCELVFDYFKPKSVPEFDSYKTSTVSAELENLLRRIFNLIPESEGPEKRLELVSSYIEGNADTPPHFSTSDHILRELYYLLADYYFKNKELPKAIKFYKYDVCFNSWRIDSWAGLALAKMSQLEQKLNSMDFRIDTPVHKKSIEALRCFSRAVEVDESVRKLWIEYGALAYQLHSHASRQLRMKLWFPLTPELQDIAMETRVEMLATARNCYWKASKCEAEGSEEEWLHHYMIGKVMEKKRAHPKHYLEHYKQAAIYLHEEEAKYPQKINYNFMPPHLSLEALEMYYRLHVAVMKHLLRITEPETRENMALFDRYLTEAKESPFATRREKHHESQDSVSSADDSQSSVASIPPYSPAHQRPVYHMTPLDHNYSRQKSSGGETSDFPGTETDTGSQSSAEETDDGRKDQETAKGDGDSGKRGRTSSVVEMIELHAEEEGPTATSKTLLLDKQTSGGFVPVTYPSDKTFIRPMLSNVQPLWGINPDNTSTATATPTSAEAATGNLVTPPVAKEEEGGAQQTAGETAPGGASLSAASNNTLLPMEVDGHETEGSLVRVACSARGGMAAGALKSSPESAKLPVNPEQSIAIQNTTDGCVPAMEICPELIDTPPSADWLKKDVKMVTDEQQLVMSSIVVLSSGEEEESKKLEESSRKREHTPSPEPCKRPRTLESAPSTDPSAYTSIGERSSAMKKRSGESRKNSGDEKAILRDYHVSYSAEVSAEAFRENNTGSACLVVTTEQETKRETELSTGPGVNSAQTVSEKTARETETIRVAVGVEEQSANNETAGGVEIVETHQQDAILRKQQEDLFEKHEEREEMQKEEKLSNILDGKEKMQTEENPSDTLTKEERELSRQMGANSKASATVVADQKTSEPETVPKVDEQPGRVQADAAGLDDKEYKEWKHRLQDKCIEGLHVCLSRFPTHYKSSYRLAYLYFASDTHKNLEYARDLLLGNPNWQNLKYMPSNGLFSERRANNFFNGMWKIPIDEIDRSGSFASHVNRSVQLLLEVLRDLGDVTMLLQVYNHLKKKPLDQARKYLRDGERLVLAHMALGYTLDAVHLQLLRSEALLDRQLEVLLSAFRAFTAHRNSPQHERASFLLQTAYQHVALTQKIQLGYGSLEQQAIYYCHSLLASQTQAQKLERDRQHLASVSSGGTSTPTTTPTTLTFPTPSAPPPPITTITTMPDTATSGAETSIITPHIPTAVVKPFSQTPIQSVASHSSDTRLLVPESASAGMQQSRGSMTSYHPGSSATGRANPPPNAAHAAASLIRQHRLPGLTLSSSTSAHHNHPSTFAHQNHPMPPSAAGQTSALRPAHASGPRPPPRGHQQAVFQTRGEMPPALDLSALTRQVPTAVAIDFSNSTRHTTTVSGSQVLDLTARGHHPTSVSTTIANRGSAGVRPDEIIDLTSPLATSPSRRSGSTTVIDLTLPSRDSQRSSAHPFPPRDVSQGVDLTSHGVGLSARPMFPTFRPQDTARGFRLPTSTQPRSSSAGLVRGMTRTQPSMSVPSAATSATAASNSSGQPGPQVSAISAARTSAGPASDSAASNDLP